MFLYLGAPLVTESASTDFSRWEKMRAPDGRLQYYLPSSTNKAFSFICWLFQGMDFMHSSYSSARKLLTCCSSVLLVVVVIVVVINGGNKLC